MLSRAQVPLRISFCCKPRGGLRERTVAAWQFDPIAAVMIGDDQDLGAVAAAGVRGIRFKVGGLLDCVRGAVA